MKSNLSQPLPSLKGWPDPKDDRPLVLVFGGTFDPPHLAHIRQPDRVRQIVGASKVIYVPAGQSPFKLNSSQTDAALRMKMLERALADCPWAELCRFEVDRLSTDSDEPSYTITTIRHLLNRYDRHARLRLLIGADQLLSFHRWRAWEAIEQLASPIVMIRPPWTPLDLIVQLPLELRSLDWSQRLVAIPVEPHSSTDIRRRVAAGESTEGLLHPEVRRLIDEHGLYREASDGGD